MVQNVAEKMGNCIVVIVTISPTHYQFRKITDDGVILEADSRSVGCCRYRWPGLLSVNRLIAASLFHDTSYV